MLQSCGNDVLISIPIHNLEKVLYIHGAIVLCTCSYSLLVMKVSLYTIATLA